MITFLEAYRLHGPDTLAIAYALGITEQAADRLVNAKMDALNSSRAENLHVPETLREIRARRPA